MSTFLVPGKLIDIERVILSTGGAVSNTGIALARLGVSARLIGKVGNDLFGQAILDMLRQNGAHLADAMIVAEGEVSSFTVVISPPGHDRIFLHCPGTNDTFGEADVTEEKLRGARLFHFGYPPLMRRMFSDGGAELTAILRRAKGLGLTTSLDLARPDPESDAGKVDWLKYLERVLPHVDVFLPSWDEILFILNRELFDTMQHEALEAGKPCEADLGLLNGLAERLIGMGAAIVAFKLGGRGLYVRTTDDAARLGAMGGGAPGDIEAWRDRELLAGCFKVDVVGTTGSGDCTIAGFLAGLLRGQTPEETLTTAVAVGACNVEAGDATSGIPALEVVEARIAAGWERLETPPPPPEWQWNAAQSVWAGMRDARRAE